MAACPPGSKSSKKRVQKSGQNSWNVFGNQARSKPDPGLAMQPSSTASRLERIRPLSEKTRNQTGQNVA
jgi:hypothetical protein